MSFLTYTETETDKEEQLDVEVDTTQEQEEEEGRENNALLNLIDIIYGADKLIKTSYLPGKVCFHVKSLCILISDCLMSIDL